MVLYFVQDQTEGVSHLQTKGRLVLAAFCLTSLEMVLRPFRLGILVRKRQSLGIFDLQEMLQIYIF